MPHPSKQEAIRKVCAKMVKDARKKAGLTQLDLASKLNTKQEAISRIENARTEPSISLLSRIAKATSHEFRFSLLITNK